MTNTLRILGTRGVPAAHGGFETFAEQLAHYLVGRGWRVVVYCHSDGAGPHHEDFWQGIERVHIPVSRTGPAGTVVFDWLATRHAARHRDLCLTLGYNTGVFSALLRWRGVPNLINMDGIEWSRAKWGPGARAWLWASDWAACWLANHLVADHPAIKAHLMSRVGQRKVSTIPYGADAVGAAPEAPLHELGLVPGRFLTVIARPEPENSLLEIVKGFSQRPRGVQLAVLGRYDESHPYHRAVKAAAGPEVRFLGAVYDKAKLRSLRFHSLAYVHGHQVGGTNPSLVEALGAGNAVLAHDNPFNRWVAGEGAVYFKCADTLSAALDGLLANPARVSQLQSQASSRFAEEFTWPHVLGQYERLLQDARWQAGASSVDALAS